MSSEGDVHRRNLPLLERVGLAAVETANLFLLRYREVELEEQDAAVDQHALQFGALAQELEVFLPRAEPHDPLDAGPVVPGAVEEDHFAGGGQVLDVSLEVPLPALDLAGLVKGHDARAPGVEVLHETLDRATLARRVPALEKDDDLPARTPDPALYLEQFDLEWGLLFLVFAPLHLLGVGIDTLPEDAPEGFGAEVDG